MAWVMNKVFRSLIPKGVFTFSSLNLISDALSPSIQRVYEYAKGTVRECNPSTAVDTKSEWAEMLGTTMFETDAAFISTYTGTGGQCFSYLKERLNYEFPDLKIIKTGVLEYLIQGNVTTTNDWLRVQSIIARYYPYYCSENYNVRITESLNVAVCGIGVCGEARTGKKE
ncbi:MAG: hypothetical protein GY760_03445 [Deltaproteobacteria bacterium]|nr:hypothetical protein [Deltaproteobacteria bacterium]